MLARLGNGPNFEESGNCEGPNSNESGDRWPFQSSRRAVINTQRETKTPAISGHVCGQKAAFVQNPESDDRTMDARAVPSTDVDSAFSSTRRGGRQRVSRPPRRVGLNEDAPLSTKSTDRIAGRRSRQPHQSFNPHTPSQRTKPSMASYSARPSWSYLRAVSALRASARCQNSRMSAPGNNARSF